MLGGVWAACGELFDDEDEEFERAALSSEYVATALLDALADRVIPDVLAAAPGGSLERFTVQGDEGRAILNGTLGSATRATPDRASRFDHADVTIQFDGYVQRLDADRFSPNEFRVRGTVHYRETGSSIIAADPSGQTVGQSRRRISLSGTVIRIATSDVSGSNPDAEIADTLTFDVAGRSPSSLSGSVTLSSGETVAVG